MTYNLESPLRILFISRAYPPIVGGIEKQNYEIYRALKANSTVKLLANSHGKLFLPLFLPYAIVYTIFRCEKFDAILLGDGVLAILAWFLRVFKKTTPLFCIVHGLDLTFANPLYQRLWIDRFFQKIDLVIPVSRQTANMAIKCGIPADRCHVIPNGVNPEEFTTHFNLFDFQNIIDRDIAGKQVILTVGRLVERKGVHWFIENVVPKLDDEIIYAVVGDGPMKMAIEKLVVQQNLGVRVIILGKVSDSELRIIYAGADVFVQPNIPIKGDMEGFGLVVLEACASGLPVIASRLEGLTDAISEDDNGQLVTPGCVDEFVEHIHALTRNAVMRQEKGLRAQDYVRKHFPWNVIAARYLETFQKYSTKKAR